MICACVGFGKHFTSPNASKIRYTLRQYLNMSFVVVARQSTSKPARPSEAQKYDTVGKLF
jgi:hypothetical protein